MVGVRDEIDEHLVELVRIRPQDREVRSEIQRHLHVAHAELVREQLDALAHDLAERHALPLERLLACTRRRLLLRESLGDRLVARYTADPNLDPGKRHIRVYHNTYPIDDSAKFFPKMTPASIRDTPMIVASLICPLRHTNM